jgi:hypothetical protein
VEENKMSDKENKKINFEGVCPFCGQVSLDEECNCDGAQRERKIQSQIQRATDTIYELFGPDCTENGYAPVADESIKLMREIVEQVAYWKMYSASLHIANGIKAKFSRTASGKIKIERSETKKQSLEVED